MMAANARRPDVVQPRMCTRPDGIPKVSYGDRQSARNGARRLGVRGEQYVYTCRSCGRYHLATR